MECKKALNDFREQKKNKNELLEEISMGLNLMIESSFCKTIGSGSGNGSGSVSGSVQPIPRGPMDKFTILEPRQSTLNTVNWSFYVLKRVSHSMQ